MPQPSTEEINRESPLSTKEQLNSAEELKISTIEEAIVNQNSAKNHVKQWLDNKKPQPTDEGDHEQDKEEFTVLA